jgi:hypothetical protein
MGSADPSKAAKYPARFSESRIARLEKELGVKPSEAQLRGKPRKGELPISVRYRISSKGTFSFFDRNGEVMTGVRIIGESKRRFHDYEDAYELALSGPTAEERAKGEKKLRSFAKVKIYDAEGKRYYPATDVKIIKKALKSAGADQRARVAERFYEREG